MKKLRYLFLLIVLLAGAYLWLMRDFPQQESTLIFNGNILTMEDGAEEPEALYIEKGENKSAG